MISQKKIFNLFLWCAFIICIPQFAIEYMSDSFLVKQYIFAYSDILSSICIFIGIVIIHNKLISWLMLGLLVGILVNYMHNLYGVHPSLYIDGAIVFVCVIWEFIKRRRNAAIRERRVNKNVRK